MFLVKRAINENKLNLSSAYNPVPSDSHKKLYLKTKLERVSMKLTKSDKENNYKLYASSS